MCAASPTSDRTGWRSTDAGGMAGAPRTAPWSPPDSDVRRHQAMSWCAEGVRVAEGADLQLSHFLPGRILRAPSPLPVAAATGAVAFALEQDPGRGPLGSGRAVRPGPCGADCAACM
nr:unnamed protein product [Leishmania braziliensis]